MYRNPAEKQIGRGSCPEIPSKTIVAGSDAHTLLRLGSCYTLGEGRNLAEFLGSLRAGRVRISGKGGKFTHIFNDAMGVYLAYFQRHCLPE